MEHAREHRGVQWSCGTIDTKEHEFLMDREGIQRREECDDIQTGRYT